MKKYLLVLIIIITSLFSCTRASINNTANNSSNDSCNSPIYNSNFVKINRNSTYANIKALFGIDGDNYRNDFNVTDTIKYYKWYPCSNHLLYFVDCWFENGNLILAEKTIEDNSCSGNISSQSFATLSNGMTYQQSISILNDKGDNFRNDYKNNSDSTQDIHYYRFYNCSNNENYIEMWFQNNSAILITKSF